MAKSIPHSGKLSVVTGASTGIGLELAKCCAKDGMELVIVADESQIQDAVADLLALGAAHVEAIEADLSDEQGVDKLIAAVAGRPIEHLIANAGRGLGDAFLDQDWAAARHVVDTNVTGTIYLIHELGRRMRDAGQGRILITGSIAGFMPGSYQAVYNGSKAFLDSFSYALREELKDSGVTVTCLMPGATETEFFERADMMDTKVGTEKKMDPADVAKQGYDAMMAGAGQVITGWKNKMQAAMAHVMPAEQLAKQHAKEAAPGTAKH
ncbi:MAG TPA: SDR family NAD(P)-dependent oxidoreductase [Rhizomicrobium sp.]